MPGIPNSSEELGVLRDIFIAEYTKAHLHVCHVSTEGSVEIIRQAKKNGVNVTCEATPHHFTLCDADINHKNSNYKMNPPLRSKKDMLAIRNALKDNTIDIIATDHAPHSEREKSKGFVKSPFGIIGFETALPLSLDLVRNNFLSLFELVDKLSCRLAKLSKIKSVKFNKKFKKEINNLLSKLNNKNDTFVHRDFHVSNLMYHNKKIALIDSQDALIGNKAYDLASLVDDVRLKTSESLKKKIFNSYLSKHKKINKKNFKNDFDILSVLRNLKIIGIFARLSIRDGKGKYLRLIPHAWELISNRINKNKVFNDLENLLKQNFKKELNGN